MAKVFKEHLRAFIVTTMATGYAAESQVDETLGTHSISVVCV